MEDKEKKQEIKLNLEIEDIKRRMRYIEQGLKRVELIYINQLKTDEHLKDLEKKVLYNPKVYRSMKNYKREK